MLNENGIFAAQIPLFEEMSANQCIIKTEEQKEYFTGSFGNDVFQCSSMPWVTYTHISHTNFGEKDNATPLFDWGKYFVESEMRHIL